MAAVALWWLWGWACWALSWLKAVGGLAWLVKVAAAWAVRPRPRDA